MSDFELIPISEEAGTDSTVLVRAWYPSEVAQDETPKRYASPVEREILTAWIERRNPTWDVDSSIGVLAEMLTHSIPDAPVLAGSHPTIVFSHGADMYPGQSTALMEELASRGFVTFSLLQNGGGFAAGPDGTVREPDQTFFDAAADLFARLDAFMSAGNDIEARHAWHREVIAEAQVVGLAREWRDRMIAVTDALQVAQTESTVLDVIAASDLSKLTYMGMSFGGSAAASAAHLDPRAVAAVNLDGLHYGADLFGVEARTPVLVLSADQANVANYHEGSDGQYFYNDFFYEEFATMGARDDVVRLRLKGTLHRDFTDLALIPGKQELDRLGSADGLSVTGAVREIVRTFLDEHVRGIATVPAEMAGVDVESIEVSHVRHWAS